MDRLLLLLLLTGCTARTQLRRVPPAPAPVVSPELCGAWKGVSSWRPYPDLPPARQLEGMVCFDIFDRGPSPSERSYVVQHDRFDESAFDPLAAALVVVGCAGDGACQASDEPESLGQTVFYAQNAQTAAVRKAVAGLGLGREVADMFVRRFDLDRAWILEQASRLGPRERAVYVGVPEQVRARFRAHAKTFAAFWRRAGKLAPRHALAVATKDAAPARAESTAADVRRLRDEYLQKCARGRSAPVQECVLGPIARPLTEALVHLETALGHAVAAAAEHALLRWGADRSTVAGAIRVAQALAIEQETARHEQWAAAKEEGVDDETLVQGYGNPPPALLPPPAWDPPRPTPGYRLALRRLQTGIDAFEGVVKCVRGRGEDVEVSFETDGDAEDGCEGDDCDGRRGAQPVLLPAAEAKSLRAGNRVDVRIDRESRRAMLVFAWKTRDSADLVQVRGVRIGR